MKVRVIKTPHYDYGGSIYEPYRPSLSQNLDMMNSAVGVAKGVNQMLQFAPTNAVNKGIDQLTGGFEKMFSKTPPSSGTTSAPQPTATPQTPAVPTNTAIPGALDGLGDLGSMGMIAQNGGPIDPSLNALYKNIGNLLNQVPQAQNGLNTLFNNSNTISVPVMKDGGQTFITSQPAYTKKSQTYFGTSNAPARDSYTDNNAVNTTVKPVDPEISNIEAEFGEFIYSDQGLYKILGEKHTNGGTPLVAKGGEFIFSAHTDMCIDVKLQEEAKLKTPPSKKCKDNTPAKILERNVDVKDYNRLKTIIANPKSDNITKKTAQFMLDKMDAKIKTIAELQEAKKSPEPTEIENQYLEQSQMERDIDQQEQFQYGGFYQSGGTASSKDFLTYQTEFNNNLSDLEKQKYSVNRPKIDYTENMPAMQAPNGPGVYGTKNWWDSEHKADFINRFPEFIKENTNWDPTKKGETLKFQQWYHKYNPNYFVGNGPHDPYAFDDKFGQHTWSAPSLNKNNVSRKAEDMEPVKRDFPYIKTDAPEPKKGPLPQIQPVKPINEVSDIDIPDPYDKIRRMQGREYMNNLMATKPYFTYAAPEVQPWTIAAKQSEQPIKDQAGQSAYIAARVASKLNNFPALQASLAKNASSINDALFKVNNANAQSEANNYNQNILRNAQLANRWNDKVKTVYDQNTNVLDKTNFKRAAYFNKYSEAQQRDMLNRYYAQQDLLTTEIPFLSTYDEPGPNNSITRHTTVPINPITGKFNPKARLWDTNAVNQMSRKQDSIEQRIANLKSKGYSDKQIEQLLDKEYPDLKQNSR